MADKFESDELGISGAVRYCDFAFSVSDVLKMETEVLRSTDFKLSVPTSVDFVEYFVTVSRILLSCPQVSAAAAPFFFALLILVHSHPLLYLITGY
jgi:hypothetical protein